MSYLNHVVRGLGALNPLFGGSPSNDDDPPPLSWADHIINDEAAYEQRLGQEIIRAGGVTAGVSAPRPKTTKKKKKKKSGTAVQPAPAPVPLVAATPSPVVVPVTTQPPVRADRKKLRAYAIAGGLLFGALYLHSHSAQQTPPAGPPAAPTT